MGTVRKVDEEYYIEFEARGLKYQQKAGRDRAIAEKMLSEIEDKIRQGEMGIIVRDADVAIFFEDFLEYARREYAAVTSRRFEKIVRHFTGWLKEAKPGIEKLSGVTPKVIDEYKAFLLERVKAERAGKKASVVNLTLILLQIILEYAIKIKYLNDNPTLHIRFIRHPQKERDALFPEAVIARMSAEKDPVLRMCAWMAMTGMTFRECMNLHWRHIDEHNRLIHVPALNNPRKINRTIPIGAVLFSILEALREKSGPEQRVFFSALRTAGSVHTAETIVEKWGKAQGENGSGRIVLLRDIFVRDLISKGISPEKILKLLGHEDVARLLRYVPFFTQRQSLLY